MAEIKYCFRKGQMVRLDKRYFDVVCCPTFTEGRKYRVMEVIRGFRGDPYRFTLRLEDDLMVERRLDATFFEGYRFPSNITPRKVKPKANHKKAKSGEASAHDDSDEFDGLV